MKNIFNLIFLFISFASVTQNVEVIQEETRTTSYQGKSYLVIKSLTIKPPANGGSFTVGAATNGPFYIRIAESAKVSNTAPSVDQNFLRTEVPLIDNITELNIAGLPVDQKMTSYNYFDGMGRALQDVTVQGSPSKSDVIKPFYYDENGWKRFDFIPYTGASTKGTYRPSAASVSKDISGELIVTGDQPSFYSTPPSGIQNDSRPYSQINFEASSLNRTVETYGAGSEWKNENKSVKTLTRVNLAGEEIIKWKHYTSGLLEKNGTYGDNQLLIEETTDEQGLINRVYRNLRGQVILNRSGTNQEWVDTYSIYSPLGYLMIVIQPEGVSRLATEFDAAGADKQSFMDRWCFQYQYDNEGRRIARHVPGWGTSGSTESQWEYTVFDRWNRPVLVQSPAQRSRNEWTFTKYDIFNRAIISGLWNSSTAIATIRANVTASSNRFETKESSFVGYSLNTTYPTGIVTSDLKTITYYDDYAFVTTNTGYDFVEVPGIASSSEILTSVKGYTTGSKIQVNGSNPWLVNVIRYDNKYRVVQVIGDNIVQGRDRVTSQFDFLGKVKKTQTYHTSSVTSLTTLREFEYDHAGRLLNLYQTNDTGPRVLMASNKFNEVGQLIEKNIHSTDGGASFLQSVDMRYTIRGWISSINNSTLSNDGSFNNDGNDLFGMEILYNPSTTPTVNSFTTSKWYNGNIAAIKWKSDTREANVTPEEKIYGFEYDVVNRLKHAYYATKANSTWTGNAGMFDEEISGYDKNGNISGIKRSGKINGGKTTIDNLTHVYALGGTQSNRLIKLSDASNNTYGYNDGANASEEYKYDASGNLIFDSNKGISNIIYNYLNLPAIIEITRPDAVDRIYYDYDPNGIKLKMTVYKGGTAQQNGTRVWETEYAGDIQYDRGQNDANRKFSFASTPEGRVIKGETGFDYEYFYKDHQGNVRLTYSLLKETVSYRATMENPPSPSDLGAKEESTFKNIGAPNATRYQQVGAEKVNYTKSSELVLTPDKASRTNAFTGQPIGPAKSLRLQSGDNVHMEAYATYNQVTGSTSTTATSNLITALATNTFGFVSGEVAFSSFTNNAPVISGIGSASSTVPKAYLAYLFFDDSFAFVTSGAVSISTNAYNAFEKLERNFTASQSGYLYIYVANESNVSTSAGNVYFDEMLIEHQKNNKTLQVTQANDYYPYGLTFNSYNPSRGIVTGGAYSKNVTNRYGFQGQELQSDLDLGWSQFKWRMHDPAIGRFSSVDPLSEKYLYNSSYAFSENKVVSHIELEGLESVVAVSSGTPETGYEQTSPWLVEGENKAEHESGIDQAVKTLKGAPSDLKEQIKKYGYVNLLTDPEGNYVGFKTSEQAETKEESQYSYSEDVTDFGSLLYVTGGKMENTFRPKLDAFRDDLGLVKFGLEVSAGLQGLNGTLSVGAYSTTPRNVGLFSDLKGEAKFNNISLVSFFNPDVSLKIFIGFESKPVAGNNILSPAQYEARLGSFSATHEQGNTTFGYVFGKPTTSFSYGRSVSTDAFKWKLKSETTTLSK